MSRQGLTDPQSPTTNHQHARALLDECLIPLQPIHTLLLRPIVRKPLYRFRLRGPTLTRLGSPQVERRREGRPERVDCVVEVECGCIDAVFGERAGEDDRVGMEGFDGGLEYEVGDGVVGLWDTVDVIEGDDCMGCTSGTMVV